MQHAQHTNDAEKRFATEVRPFAAMAATTRFLMDVEQTHHVFKLTDALDSAQNEKNFQRYIKTEVGVRLNAEGFDLTGFLSERSRLERYPAGSVGREYIDFLDRENLDLGMLLAAEQVAERAYSHLDEPRRKFIAAGTANHDLLHVLTGYGREPLGEALLLTFTAQQFGLRGIAMLGHLLAMREWALHPGWPVLQLLGEAKAIAREMVWIAEIDWREILPLPLNAARQRLRLPAPAAYLKHRGSVPETSLDDDTHRAEEIPSKAA